MRLLSLAVLLAACAADPVLLPDSGPCSSACGPGTVCSGGACVAVDAGAMDVVAVADAGLDVPAIVDRPTAVDAPIAVDRGTDAGSTDAGVDVPRADGGVCPNGLTAFCDGRTVRLTTGERDGGVDHFCGSCTNHCGEGEFCVGCRCER